MKITKAQLRELIKEELEASMEGADPDPRKDRISAIHDILSTGAPERYQAAEQADPGALDRAMEAMSPEDLKLTHDALEAIANEAGMIEQFFAMLDPLIDRGLK